MGDAATWAGAVMAAGSLVVAIVALVKSSRAEKQANAASKRIVEIEEEREKNRRKTAQTAKLRVELRREDTIQSLIVFNDGEAEARDVHIFLNEVPFHEHKFVMVNGVQRPIIGPKTSVSYPMARLVDSPALPYRISIQWKDDSGELGRYRSEIS